VPDAYSDWLDIPANLRPPTYYQLLGIAPSELDPKVIAAASGERLERLRPHGNGPRADEARRLAREVVQARDTLLDPVARLRYDTLTPDAADPWWKPETDSPSTTSAPVQGWWQGEVPDEPSPVPAAPPTPAVVVEPAPAPSAAAPTKDWWKAEPGDLPPEPAPVRQAPPPPPVPPPPPPPVTTSPATPATAPVIREQSLAYTAPEASGSPVLWVLAGLFIVGVAGGAVLYLTKPWATAGPAPETNPVVEPKENGGPAVAVVTSTTVRPAVHTTPATTVPKPVATRATTPGKVTETAPPQKNTKPPESDGPVPAMTFRGHNGGVFGVAVSRSGKTILSISDDRAVLQYSPKERGKHGVVHKLGSPGLAVVLCDDDRLAAFCDGGETVVYNLPGRKVMAKFENPRGGIRSLAAAPDGSFVLTGTTDGVVRWWGTKSKEIEHMLDLDAKATVTALAVAPDGRTLAAGLSDGRVATWDLKGRRETKRWPAHKGAVTAVAWSPDGRRIASTGEDGVANVWQPGGGLVKKLAGHDGPVTGVAWCPDGKRVLTAGIDQTVRLWAEGKGWKADGLAQTTDKAFCLALDGRGRFVVVGLADGAVQLVPVPTAAAGSHD
jgi:hypothetical protein